MSTRRERPPCRGSTSPAWPACFQLAIQLYTLDNRHPTAAATAGTTTAAALAARRSGTDPLAQFALPDSWEAEFWAIPGVKELPALDPKALADLVPIQAGLRHCRCAGCDASEADDPLAWSIQQPMVLEDHTQSAPVGG